ncbi:MAG TPA: SsrA-binding protein SmpB [bacterium]|nr:SsrA-binding protein SmpB [bacterium]
MAKKPKAKLGDPGTLEYANKKALHNYEIHERFETGVVLQGAEVKSLRSGGGDLQDAFAKVENGELWLHGMKISPYEYDHDSKYTPKRPRKLLMHKREILKLRQKALEKGFTLVPLRAYFKEGRVKIEIGLAKGRKSYERRAVIAERDASREIDRAKKLKHAADD